MSGPINYNDAKGKMENLQKAKDTHKYRAPYSFPGRNGRSMKLGQKKRGGMREKWGGKAVRRKFTGK